MYEVEFAIDAMNEDGQPITMDTVHFQCEQFRKDGELVAASACELPLTEI